MNEAIANGKKEKASENILEDWGSYMAAKKAKLEDQFQQLAESEFRDATSIFKGIAIFVNGYTHPCADILKRLMMEHGGIYHHYLRSNTTTHLIASNLPYSKIIQYRKSKNPLPLCKPEWITDSIKANKLLDWRPYLLYSSTSVTQPQLQFENDEKKTPKPDDFNLNSNELPKEKTDKLPMKQKTEALCSKNEEFISEFYNNSRLHHIATMGATFKEYINELRSQCKNSYPGLERLKHSKNPKSSNNLSVNDDSDSEEDSFEPKLHYNKVKNSESVIMHIDMDCFFVSVGLRNRPELKGQPVAVTHAKGNKQINGDNEEREEFGSMAEIASCSYEAREKGVKNGMFLGQALKLCPNLKTIKYDFEGYKEVSYTLYDTVASYTLEIEAVSCDEMYVDISQILTECNLTTLEFSKIIRSEIKDRTGGCHVSTGFGKNKLQARLATKKAKPDGQYHLMTEEVESYISDMSVRDIPGVGWSTMKQLRNMNVQVCKDLRNITLSTLQKEFGKKTGEMLFNTCRGIDNSKLNIEHVRKSVSAEVNYGIRFENDNDARNFLIKLSKEVCTRLIKINTKGQCITLKLMVRAKNAPKDPSKFMGHGVCDNFTKSKNIMTPVNDENIIMKDVLQLWEQMQQPANDIRGIGIQISRLDNTKSKNDVNTTNLINFIAKNKSVNEKKHEMNSHSVGNSNSTESMISKKEKQVKLKEEHSLGNFFPKNESIIHDPEDEMKNNDAAISRPSGEMVVKGIKLNEENSQKKMHINDNRNVEKETFSPLSQGIDENILAELPEEIRKEILASKPIVKKSQLNPIDNYFKHRKPGIWSKPKMPSMQELDMKVLIELPDDIRNEILNEYRANNDQLSNINDVPNELDRQLNSVTAGNSREHNNSRSQAMHCSFSEIDPEFLAALDKETRDDVKNYCLAKRNEREIKSKEKINDKKQQACNQVQSKKRGRKPKSLSAGVPTKDVILGSLKKKIDKRKNEDDQAPPSKNLSFLQNEMNILEDFDNTWNNHRNKDMKSLSAMFQGNGRSNDHEKMLSTLVNYLFGLPMQQVKKQIQTWIYESNNVNNIDLLSITKYLSMLPREKRIDDLHILMKTMHR